jgi:hypothetical protein
MKQRSQYLDLEVGDMLITRDSFNKTSLFVLEKTFMQQHRSFIIKYLNMNTGHTKCAEYSVRDREEIDDYFDLITKQ